MCFLLSKIHSVTYHNIAIYILGIFWKFRAIGTQGPPPNHRGSRTPMFGMYMFFHVYSLTGSYLFRSSWFQIFIISLLLIFWDVYFSMFISRFTLKDRTLISMYFYFRWNIRGKYFNQFLSVHWWTFEQFEGNLYFLITINVRVHYYCTLISCNCWLYICFYVIFLHANFTLMWTYFERLLQKLLLYTILWERWLRHRKYSVINTVTVNL